MRFSKQRGFVGNAVHQVLAMRARMVASSFTAEDLLPYFAGVLMFVIAVGVWVAAW